MKTEVTFGGVTVQPGEVGFGSLIDVELKDTDLTDGAQGLRKLTTFVLELKLEYQDMDGNSYTKQERIEGLNILIAAQGKIQLSLPLQ